MFKFAKYIAGTVAALAMAGAVYAAGMSVQIETPKSPSNQQDLKINFVVLDSSGTNPITAKCFFYKDANPPAQFGSDIALSGGGNSANCQTNSSVVSVEGTYHFYVTATNGSDAVTSNTVNVEYKLGGPETPTSYSKEGVTSCSWKIKFHTANDGKTAKVELYRSENTSFSTDNSTRIASVNIGPNTDGEFVTDKPDCAKTYYYAIRAFDTIGNGSGVVGDSETHTVTTTVVPPAGGSGASGASGTSGAIAGGNQGNVLGASNGGASGSTGAEGTILGEASGSAVSPTPTQETYQPAAPSSKKLFLWGGIGIAVIVLVLWFMRRKKSE